jgi:hypothetical protein
MRIPAEEIAVPRNISRWPSLIPRRKYVNAVVRAMLSVMQNCSAVIQPSPFGSRVFADNTERNSSAQLGGITLDLGGGIKLSCNVSGLE